jgi:hypothetical protein
MISERDMVHITIKIIRDMMETGKMENKMVMELSYFRMVINT